MAQSYRSKWQKFSKREWSELRDDWVAYVPTFPTIGARPDPGLENLASLVKIDLPSVNPGYKREPNVEGVRRNVLWEAVFLFHKCSHTNLAAQRLGQQGMHSWSMFNAYHSAYLGARGIMALLGIALPKLKGEQTAIDLFIKPESRTKLKNLRALGLSQFQEFLIVRLPRVEQRFLWEAFQHVLEISQADCLNPSLRRELLNLSFEDITPPRNHFLYQAHYWLFNDLTNDASGNELDVLVGTSLDPSDEAFLLRLSFSVYCLFEQLIRDLAENSTAIKMQIDGSRFLLGSDVPETERYKAFLSQAFLQVGATNETRTTT